MKKILAALAGILCFVAQSFAQDMLSLNGQVVDKQSGSPMALVSVNLSGSNISIITNADGIFTLKVPKETDPETEISLSYLGYLSARYKVSDFLQLEENEWFKIQMLPIALNINPSIVKSIEPELLFSSAFRMARKNYHTEALGMTAFYREMIKKGANRYLVLNEAVVDIEKAGYAGYSSDKAALFKGRGSQNFQASDTLFIKFQGGLYSALELDIVKNPFIGTTLQVAPLFYDFSLGENVHIDGKTFYSLKFTPKEDAEPTLFKGTIYIETETLAIGRMEFDMDLEDREEEAASIFIVKQPAKMRFGVTKAHYVVNFRESDGLWYFDYSRADVSFYARKRGSLFKSTYSLTGELAVTDHKQGEFHINPEDRIRFKDIISEKVADFEDPDFWENYNVIEPDQSIEQAIRRIIRQLKRREN